MATETPVLELRAVDVAYHGDIRILQGLSLAVRRGRITGVIGPNGAGKSTALRTLYGLLKPVVGDVLIDGAVVTGTPPWRLIERIETMAADGKTVLLISHDLTSIYRLSRRVLALNQGRVIAEGGVEAIRGNPAVIEAYLGA